MRPQDFAAGNFLPIEPIANGELGGPPAGRGLMIHFHHPFGGRYYARAAAREGEKFEE